MARLVLLSLLFAVAPPTKPPTTFFALKKQLAAEPEEKQAKRFEAFARDRRPGLGERLKAAAASRRLLDKQSKALVAAWILEAHLQGVAGSSGLRVKALERAKAEASEARFEKRARLLDDVLEGERALRRLEDLVARRERERASRPLTGAEQNVVEEIDNALPAWRGIRDERTVGVARLLRARLLATTPDGKETAQLELADLVRVGGNDRDTALVRAEVRRARARLLEEAGDYANAAHEMLVADRAALVPAALPLFEAPPKTMYGRSRETSELCYRAYQQGTSCGDLEKDRFDQRSFYDFSREAPRSVFDEERAKIAAIEYTPLIMDCIKQGGSDVVDTTIELEWPIGYDGKVREYQLNPRRLRKTKVDGCFKRAFAMFRYPPYRGEMKHVGLSFTVGEQ